MGARRFAHGQGQHLSRSCQRCPHAPRAHSTRAGEGVGDAEDTSERLGRAQVSRTRLEACPRHSRAPPFPIQMLAPLCFTQTNVCIEMCRFQYMYRFRRFSIQLSWAWPVALRGASRSHSPAGRWADCIYGTSDSRVRPPFEQRLTCVHDMGMKPAYATKS
jgi:hypothetical protein